MEYGKLGATFTALNQENIEPFRTLLTADCAAAIEQGEPLTAIGLLDGEDRAWGALAGMLLGNSFVLRSLYVDPAQRRRGAGTMLLECLSDILLRHGNAEKITLDWINWGDEGDILTVFLAQAGFVVTYAPQRVYTNTLGKILENPFFKEEKASSIVPFSKLPHHLLPLDQALPAAAGSIEQNMSCAALSPDRRVEAYLLFTKDTDGNLALEYAQAEKNPLTLQHLLRYAGEAARSYPPETLLSLRAVNDSSAALADYFLGQTETAARHGELQLYPTLDFSWLTEL